MDVFELLTNPLVWAVLVGLFTKIFVSKEDENKKKQQETKKTKNQLPKPVMTTVEKPRENRRRQKQIEKQTVQQAYEKLKNHEAEQIQKNINVSPQQTRKTAMTRSQANNKPLQEEKMIFNQKTAVQGIIWSEVLGPPRSKNPHYTRHKR
jgi:inner membrane protein involved in colicin E2 resistance